MMQSETQRVTYRANNRQDNTGGVKVTTTAIVHFDGGARLPDNGPAAIGYIIEDDVWSEEQSDRIRKSMNNRR